MKVLFLRDVTVDIINPDVGVDYPYDKTIRRNSCVDCDEVIPVSGVFSNILLSTGELIIDLKNDCFQKVV